MGTLFSHNVVLPVQYTKPKESLQPKQAMWEMRGVFPDHYSTALLFTAFSVVPGHGPRGFCEVKGDPALSFGFHLDMWHAIVAWLKVPSIDNLVFDTRNPGGGMGPRPIGCFCLHPSMFTMALFMRLERKNDPLGTPGMSVSFVEDLRVPEDTSAAPVWASVPYSCSFFIPDEMLVRNGDIPFPFSIPNKLRKLSATAFEYSITP